MRQVIGNTTRELTANDFADVRANYRHLLLDLGTGDGKHALTEARRRPDTLVVGLDAGPDAMRPTAARAARKPSKGGVTNAMFVWASVEDLPAELQHVTEVHCLMPWGSLLRALVEPVDSTLGNIAAACRPNAQFLITLNLHAWRPPVPEVGSTAEPTPDTIDALKPAYARSRWTIENARYFDEAEIKQLGTSWTKRLRASRSAFDVLAITGVIHDGC